MYFPYLRGKQNELVLLKDQAELISNANFIPIIEPVKKNSLSSVIRTVEALIEHNAAFIFIMNPLHGDFFAEPDHERDAELTRLAEVHPELFNIGIIASQEQELTEIRDLCDRYPAQQLAIVHYGFDKPKLLQAVLRKFEPRISHHLFMDTHTTSTYHSFFSNHASKALIVDAFIKKPNSTYCRKDYFSDIHRRYPELGMQGFGDFTILKDEYSDTGGPAYAVAIHITDAEFERKQDIVEELKSLGIEDEETLESINAREALIVRHYVSDDNLSPANPGAKFLQALNKLVGDLDDDVLTFSGGACSAFRELHAREHYPGLGFSKRLSMQHHIELMDHLINH